VIWEAMLDDQAPGSASVVSNGESDSTAVPLRPSEARPGRSSSQKCIFSVDVEDWFHILDVPSAPPVSEWDALPSRVEGSFLRLLDIFAKRNARVTCFFLGWIARRFPLLVKEAKTRGHEVASHGCSHKLVYEMTPREFLKDATESKMILEDLAGEPILGYRSSGFSVTEDTPWFFDLLVEAGYRYDSSVFPAQREHGGLKTARLAPYLVPGCDPALVEFPITVKRVFGRPICFFGGGYLRLFPYVLIRRMARQVLEEGRPVVFYAHPREIDPQHPQLPMGRQRRFKSYVNLGTTEEKIRRLTSDFQLTTFESFIEDNPEVLRD
jgi:polysaccharide deacetylase family protein (PEP-CTERM system associated)